MSYIFKVKVISGICFKHTFLCVEQLNHISLKYKLYVVYFSKKNFFVDTVLVNFEFFHFLCQ